MTLKKHGADEGEILRDEEEQKKTAATDWTEEDDEELAEELAESDEASEPHPDR